ncbi:putative protein serine/threonine kinase [Tieghemostelium lacteum]|uniref:non-specific serine/threonine protein kinase n=1 Tax=Tieghemostelium lacteum TaxID=361077 RepID=A0A152A1Y7_TIELA|nr:putative protein serine/threonine kinase [Tieghemostelium lacteum]|eukprot:KYR00230.1 putative protein serine/threonine kinase [Tieghemostelium lacteum]
MNSSPFGSLRKKKKQAIKQSLEELISSLAELTHPSSSNSNSNNNISNSNSSSSNNLLNSGSSNSSTPQLSPHGTVQLPFPNPMISSSPPPSSSSSSPSATVTNTATSPPTRSLAKFYLLAQQLEYVGNQTYACKPDANSDPLLPIESISGILNVQWTTYWTMPLLPTTTCLDILNYISLKTNREVEQLKLADSDGKLVDHDMNLTLFRCKKFIVFEDINIEQLNSNNNKINSLKKQHQLQQQQKQNQLQQQQSNISSSPSSPSSPSPSSSSSPVISNKDILPFPIEYINLNTSSNNNNNKDKDIGQILQQGGAGPGSDSTKSTPLQLSPGIIRKHPPIVPPRSPLSFGQSSEPLFSSKDLMSDQGLSNSIPLVTGSFLHNSDKGLGAFKDSPSSSPSSSRKNSKDQLVKPNSNTGSNLTMDKDGPGEKYCKFLENTIQFSSGTPPTTEKGKILDNYFNHYYQELFKYIHQRNRRLQRLEEFIKELGIDQAGSEKWFSKHYESESNYLRNKRAGMKLQEFKILTQIGKGGFGQVFLAQKKDSGDIVTLKRIKKSSYEWANQRTQVGHEKTVMMSENCKWITKLLYAFQDSHYLYLAMEYHCGGDFRALLNNLGMLSEEEARYYMMEMIEAVHSLHAMDYVHRDIKPSNFVIDKHGHIRLIDFGLSKDGIEKRNGFNQQTMNNLRKSFIMPNPLSSGGGSGSSFLSTGSNGSGGGGSNHSGGHRNTLTSTQNGANVTVYRRPQAHSAVGSPEYMAPEIVNDEGYDHSCDWWSLGCVFVEMLCGFNPFCADTPSDVFVNILQWKQVLDWDLFCQELSPEASDILKRMLCEPSQRLGRNGIDDFKQHPFFKGHWDEIDTQKPPFIPKVESDMDTSYFEDAVNNDPNTWEIEDENHEKKNPFDNLNIPFFTYRKSSALSSICDQY